MNQKNICFGILFLLVLLVILSIIYTTARKEYFLSPSLKQLQDYSTKEWLKQSYSLCIPRVKSECQKDDFNCIYKSLRDCQNTNENSIRSMCLKEAETKLCSQYDNPTESSKCKVNISYLAQSGFLCSKPDLR